MASIEQIKADIKRRLEAIGSIEADQKARKAQVEDALLQDPEFQRLDNIAKQAAKAASLQKEAVLNEPEYNALLQEMKDVAKEKKELSAVLTGELLGYTRETDSFQIETPDGALHNIQYRAKVVKTNQPTLV
jgi:hypothetical protein